VLDQSFATPEDAAEYLELGLYLLSPEEDWRETFQWKTLRLAPKEARRYPLLVLTRDEVTLKISLPPHVGEILESWAVDELGETPAAVLEALADELCSNEELRTFVTELLRDA
jgi:hypothetical protein